MAVQDLTPQLRTRLSRMERAVGWFVLLATLILLAGFGYYVYHTATRKGWFIPKAPYFTYVADATGLRVGDPVRLMGFDVGQITSIEAEDAENHWARMNNYNVVVQFEIRRPYYGYVLTDSEARIGTGDFLGKRVLEVTRGSTGLVTVITVEGNPLRILNNKAQNPPEYTADYVPIAQQPQGFWIHSTESPALTERLDSLASQVEGALPGIFQLTNQLSLVLSSSTSLTGEAAVLMEQLRPFATNLLVISTALTNPVGSLGEWLFPTNISRQLEATLAGADATLYSAETNLNSLTYNLNETLINLAQITSNFNAQVQNNDQILSQISRAVTQADELMQGLKGHWLLRSAFRDRREPGEPGPRTRPPPPQAGKHRRPPNR